MAEASTKYVPSISVGGLLGVLFVYLKLTHQIDWSWWWVTAPFWGPVALVVGMLILWFGVVATVVFFKWLFSRRPKNRLNDRAAKAARLAAMYHARPVILSDPSLRH
jgi:hypothetical protein